MDLNRVVRYETSSPGHITCSFALSLSYRSLLTCGGEGKTVDGEREEGMGARDKLN